MTIRLTVPDTYPNCGDCGGLAVVHHATDCIDPDYLAAPVPTLTIPDDPEAIALVLCRDHLDCRDHIGGHDAYVWQAKRLLADLRRLT